MALKLTFIIIASYLIGSISPSVLISRAVGGFDIRSKGSGNAGTTNMLRLMGWGWGILTFALDVLKGVICTLMGMYLLEGWGGAAAGMFAILGHAFPLYQHFRGGKGVATACGIMFCMHPLLTLCALATHLIISFSTRIVSLATCIVFTLMPLATFLWPAKYAQPTSALTIVVCALVLFLHRKNIQRLFTGSEKKLSIRSGNKKKKQQPCASESRQK